MKTASSALINYLNASRPAGDSQLYIADCYTITLASGSAVGIANGTVLTYTSIDLPVLLNGSIYQASGPQFSGLKYKCETGVNVDSQKLTISAWPQDTIGGAPFLQGLQQGLLDGAEIRRDRAFFSSFDGVTPLTPIGSILLFRGRVTSVDEIGRTTAQVTVASDLTLLAIDMPRNVYAPNCIHALYDAGCGVNRAACTSSGSIGAGSTRTLINWSGATSNFQQGAIIFTSGANDAVEATVKSAGAGYLQLAYPLPNIPVVGDTFTTSWGCDHTQGTCTSLFSNLANFRGFPYVPPPQVITGPLATYSTISSKGGK